jgi:hypothetical protein
MDEGYAEFVAWLERPAVIAAIAEICIASRSRDVG